MAKVIEQRLANRRQERHGGMRIGLGVADMQGFFAPVHVLKAQATDFAFAQAICRKQLKYRMIAQPSRRQVRLRSCQHRRDLLRVQRRRSEEHTSELQSLMRTSYSVFCLSKKHNP